VLQSLFNPRVLALAQSISGSRRQRRDPVFAAQIIKQLGSDEHADRLYHAIPMCSGPSAMIVWGTYSDRKNERR